MSHFARLKTLPLPLYQLPRCRHERPIGDEQQIKCRGKHTNWRFIYTWQMFSCFPVTVGLWWTRRLFDLCVQLLLKQVFLFIIFVVI